MKILAQIVTLGALLIGCTSALSAQSVTCYTATGYTAFTLPITSLFFDTPVGTSGHFTVTAALAQYSTMLENEAFSGNYSECSFTPSNGTLPQVVNIEDVSETYNSTEQYISVTFSYRTLNLSSSGTTMSTQATAAQPTAAEKHQALQEYLLRVPKPPASATSPKQ